MTDLHIKKQVSSAESLFDDGPGQSGGAEILKGVSGKTYVVRTGVEGERPEIPGVVPDVVEAVRRRGVENLHQYFSPKLRNIDVDPLDVHNMKEAVCLVMDAITNEIPIGFIGDYDVDGATSVSQFVLYLRGLGVHADFLIPQRMTDGYGANDRLIDDLFGKGVRLLIILDSGTVSHAPIAYARSLGMQVIVIDHHKPGEDWTSPDAVVINPHQPADTSGLRYLCTAGLVMFLLMALNRELRKQRPAEELPDLRSLMGLTALGTVADLMPLEGLNRIFVSSGLKVLCATPGLAALVRAVRLEREPVASDLGFLLGPCINAGGRLGDCMQGATLLTTEDEDLRHELAAGLVRQNTERKGIQKSIEAEALEQLGKPNGRKLAIARSEDWHPGIVGIVAARVKQQHDCPAIVIGKGGKGSGRSAHDFDLGTCIIEAREAGLLKAGGGHNAAVGLTVDDDRFDEFVAFVAGRTERMERKSTVLDMEIRPETIRFDYVEGFKAMEPTGQGNPSPVFLFSGMVLQKADHHPNGHLRLTFRDSTGYRIGGWLFNVAGTEMEAAALEAVDRECRMVGVLDSWNGRPSVKIDDIIMD